MDLFTQPHPEPRNHPRMSREKRAAQFSSFAALTGYEDMVEDSVRRHEDETR